MFVLFLVFLYKLDDITDHTVRLIDTYSYPVIDAPNEYSYNRDYFFVKKSKDFVPYSKGDLIDIFYSILDNGYDTFTFYCPSEYVDCISDTKEISKDRTLLTNVGNFVHPYNNFINIKVISDNLGEVDVIVTKLYNSEMINTVDRNLDSMLASLDEDLSIEDKILKAHDYIIDTASYDVDDSNENSGNAYGLFTSGKVKCSGYADAMAIVLSKLGVQNYKIASKEHVWNAVYLNDEWSHLDVTWDDPVVTGNTNVTDTIRHKFFMIDTPTLTSYNTLEHNFDKNIYMR